MEPREREILELVLLQNITPVEAGAQLGLEKWGAYKAYERALRHLHPLIAEHGTVRRQAGKS